MIVKCKHITGGQVSAPGEIKFTGRVNLEGIYGMVFSCPCGCGTISILDFDISPDVARPKWKWNGNKEQPTLTPSIRKTSECKWHGFLTDGVFKSV